MRRRADLDLRERGGAALGTAARHQRRVERAGDVELDRADAARRAARPRRPRSPAGAGEHELAGRVVVGDGDAVRGGDRLRRRRRRRRARRASCRRRASDISRPRSDDQPQRVALGDRAGGGERAQLAERVAGDGVGAAASSADPAGERGAEDRGLREARVLVGARERILADELGDELEQVGRGRRRQSRMPGVWLAWPGKRTAVGMSSHLRVRSLTERWSAGLPPERGEGREPVGGGV